MDETTNSGIQANVEVPQANQGSSVEANTTPTEATFDGEIGSYEDFLKTYDDNKDNEKEPEQDIEQDVEQDSEQNVEQGKPEEKVLIGEKEYTKEELQNLIEGKSENQFRSVEAIAKDYNDIVKSEKSDYLVMFKDFLARANVPMSEVDGKQVPNSQAVLEAIREGLSTGDYTNFIQYLNPLDVQNFLNAKSQIEASYAPLMQKIGEEYQSVRDLEKKKVDLQKWDGFIQNNAKDPQEKFMLNYFKDKYGFDEGQQKEFLQKLREARALDINNQVLTQQTEEVKRAMMGSNTNTQTKPKTSSFSADSISKMSNSDFLKNEKTIIKALFKK